MKENSTNKVGLEGKFMAYIKNSDRVQMNEVRQRRSPPHICEPKQLKEKHVFRLKKVMMYCLLLPWILFVE